MTGRTICCLGLLTVGLLAASGCRREISGTYLATDPNGAVWLQLVRTPDNHLTGQLAISTLKPDQSRRSQLSFNHRSR